MFKPVYLVALVLIFISACSQILSISAADDDEVQKSYHHGLESSPLTLDQPAPDFSAQQASGDVVSIHSISAEQPILLLFYRGEWCPFCISQLNSIKSVLPELKTYGVQVVAVSPDEQSATTNTQRQFGQGFIFLSDPSGNGMKTYNIAKDDKLPHPAVYLINKGGNLKWYYVDDSYMTRPTGEQLLDVVRTHLN